MNNFPWAVKLCTGGALQFIIMGADGSMVMMAEMYSEAEMFALLSLFQRNPEITVEMETFRLGMVARKYQKAKFYLDDLPAMSRAKYMERNNDDVIKAAEDAEKGLKGNYEN